MYISKLDNFCEKYSARKLNSFVLHIEACLIVTSPAMRAVGPTGQICHIHVVRFVIQSSNGIEYCCVM